MKTYNIEWDCLCNFGGHSDIIIVEDFEWEQDAVDKLIDKLERDEIISVYFYTNEVIESDKIDESMYITGGTHGLNLITNGYFNIREVL